MSKDPKGQECNGALAWSTYGNHRDHVNISEYVLHNEAAFLFCFFLSTHTQTRITYAHSFTDTQTFLSPAHSNGSGKLKVWLNIVLAS